MWDCVRLRICVECPPNPHTLPSVAPPLPPSSPSSSSPQVAYQRALTMGMAGLRKIVPQRLTGQRFAVFEGGGSSRSAAAGSSSSAAAASLLSLPSLSPSDALAETRERERAAGAAAIRANIDAAANVPRVGARQGSCSWTVLGGPRLG